MTAQRLQLEDASQLVKARLLLGLGRSSMRFSRGEQSALELAAAAELAQTLGDEGYETRIIALLLLGFVLPPIGRADEASAVLDEAIRGCEERRDLLHLGPALNNRALVRGYCGDCEGTITDFQAVIAHGKKLGQLRIELIGYYNLAEYLYQTDDTDAAGPYIACAEALAQKSEAATSPEIVHMLDARVKLYRGEVDDARRIVRNVRAAQSTARANQNGLEILSPSEDVFAAAIEAATCESSDEDWDAILKRSQSYSVGQEQIEIIETRALWALRHGRIDEAARLYHDALNLSNHILTVMIPRLHRGIARAQASSRIS